MQLPPSELRMVFQVRSAEKKWKTTCSKEYTEKRGDQCVTIDIEFQDKQNTKPSSTPFGC